MAIKYDNENLRIADFRPAEIQRPEWELKVIAPQFLLNGKQKTKKRCHPLIKFWSICLDTYKFVIINVSPYSPDIAVLIQTENPAAQYLP